MTDETPIWRQAIQDNQHPLHQAAWLLFSERMNVKLADKLLLPQKDAVVQFIFQILDNEELSDSTAFGGGMGPVHGIELLGHWGVEDVIPRLLNMMQEQTEADDIDSYIHDATMLALEKFAPKIKDTLLEMTKTADAEMHITLASMLSNVKGDAQVGDYLKRIFDAQKDHWNIAFTAENVLAWHPLEGIAFLQERLNKRKYPANTRKRLLELIEMAQKGEFDD